MLLTPFWGGENIQMRKKLTNRQQEILDFIKKYTEDIGYPPTVREIGGDFGMSEKGAFDHLRAIEKKGYIRRDPRKPRAIEILDFVSRRHHQDIIEVPIVGKIAAGEPLLAEQNITGTLPLPKAMVSDDNAFALRVKGDSMVNAGIFDGDYVVVKGQSNAEQGDIVVALLEDEATVKRFYLENNTIRLQPENPGMSPIIAKDVLILGKVIGLFRRM